MPDWNLPGVNVTASDVTIANLLISNFSTGISAFQADDLVLSYVYVEDVEGIGIHIDSSTDVSIGDSSVIRSVSSNIIVEDNSTGVFIQNSIIGWSEESGVIVRKNSDDFEMTNVLLDENEDYGCLLSSNNAIITYSNMHNNGLNGVFVQSVSGASISHNDFKGNGLSEARVISSYEVKVDYNNFNPRDLENGGWGLDVSSSQEIEIEHNIFQLGVRFTGVEDSLIFY